MSERLVLQGYPRKARGSARLFHARGEVCESEPGAWQITTMRIFRETEEIGSYERNYPDFGEETFEPFERNGKWYALYSPDYTCTRIMALPDCRDIGGEEPCSEGFCPVELFVPRYRVWRFSRPNNNVLEGWNFESDAEESGDVVGPWKCLDTAFVAGCVWGDDSSWKLQAFDLSQIEDGILLRDERFGYLEIAGGLPLAAAIRLSRSLPGPLRARISRQETRDIVTGKRVHHYTNELEG